LWSLYYLRWWFVQRITGLVPLVYLRGSIMMNLYARAMGMKVGRNVFLNSFHCEAWDLIELGEDASIGCDAHLANFHVENGYLTISRIRVGARAYVGVRSIVQGDCTIEPDGHLAAMSLLSHGKTIPRGQAWRGAPAKKVAEVDNKFRHEDETPEQADEEEWTGGASDEEKQGAGGGTRMRNNKPASATGANSLNQGLMSDAGSSGSNSRRWGRPSMCRLFWLGFAQFWFLCGVLSSIILVSASPGLVAIHYIMDLPGSDLFPSISTVDVWWQVSSRERAHVYLMFMCTIACLSSLLTLKPRVFVCS
jgi:carbonic anhydrase/acetyltransferase-like protein (isoleucine patch superfamily)